VDFDRYPLPSIRVWHTGNAIDFGILHYDYFRANYSRKRLIFSSRMFRRGLWRGSRLDTRVLELKLERDQVLDQIVWYWNACCATQTPCCEWNALYSDASKSKQ
jgi:hypothetical protein